MKRPGARAVAALLAFSLLPTSAVAQNPPRRSGDAAAHFERGTTFYSEGDYSGSLVEFKRAYEIDPSWQVLFNIGQSYFQLRDYANALLTLRRFASEGGDRIGKDDRATLDSELPDLGSRVGHLAVESNMEGASVVLDGRAAGKTPLAEPLLVSAGIRKIAAFYDGRPPVERDVSVGGGDAITVRLDFAPATDLRPSPAKPSQGEPARTLGPNRLPSYVSFAVAAAGVAAGSVFGVLTMGDKSRLDDACSAGRACPTNAQGNIDALARDGAISTVGFGVGAAAAALGVTLWLIAHPTPASLGYGPTPMRWAGLGPGFVGGSF